MNGVVLDVRAGKGTAGLLLEDKATAADVKQSIANVRQTTDKLNDSTTRIDNLLADVQSRQLVPKMDDTLSNAKVATQNLDQTTQQINTTLKSAFAQDQYGEDAGANLQQSLTNLNQASGNLTDDTEALKHEFFFKGFFKHRGYDSLDDLAGRAVSCRTNFQIVAREPRMDRRSFSLHHQSKRGRGAISRGQAEYRPGGRSA